MKLEHTADTNAAIDRNFEKLEDLSEGLLSTAFFIGNNTPNGQVTSNPGAIYINRLGGAGTTLWVKETGTGTSAGWVGK